MNPCIYGKEMKRQQSVNAVKTEIKILEEHQKHWLIELNDHDKNILKTIYEKQYVKTLNLPNKR